MNNKFKYLVFVMSAVALLNSCEDDNDGPNYGNGGATGTSVSLKDSSPVTIGMETDYAALEDANYLQTAAANASQTTFGYTMTHSAVVQNDGTFGFSMANTQMNAVNAAGLKVWGRNLCWYQKQNAYYIKNFAGLGDPANVLADGNPDFEDWDDNQAIGWLYENGLSNSGGAYCTYTQATDKYHGNSAMAITSLRTSSSQLWQIQLSSTAFPTIKDHEYSVNFYAKASTSGCKYQGEWDHKGSAIYTGGKDLSTDWTKYTMVFGDGGLNPKGTGNPVVICFDMAGSPVGAVVYLDNITIVDETQAKNDADPENQLARLNEAFENWVTGIVTYYKGKVVGWDVVNELFADDGSIRTNNNTANASATDWFVWSHYLGENIGVKAFSIAHAADPDALLFINESGLESNSKKLDAFIEYVKWLKGQGAPVNGIGVEMHINIATAIAGVDYMFQKLAAIDPNLKIRISGLDVSVNRFAGTSASSSFTLTPQVLEFQAVTYHDVVASYLRNVPEKQRQDITIWGVNDPTSWKYNNGTDFPLLFDENYRTKPAFDGFLQALKGK